MQNLENATKQFNKLVIGLMEEARRSEGLRDIRDSLESSESELNKITLKHDLLYKAFGAGIDEYVAEKLSNTEDISYLANTAAELDVALSKTPNIGSNIYQYDKVRRIHQKLYEAIYNMNHQDLKSKIASILNKHF